MSDGKKTKNRKLDIIFFESDIEPMTGRRRGQRKQARKKQKPSSKGQVWEFIAIATVPLVLVLGNSMLVPILPVMEDKLGISKFQSSLVITLFSVMAG